MSANREDGAAIRGFARFGAMALLLAGVAGCDKLLEVDLPTAVTEEALDEPATAALQVNSIVGLVECAYSSLAIDAAGFEDNFQRVTGVAGIYSEYRVTPAGGTCDADVYSQSWVNPFLTARRMGYDVYDRLDAWTDDQVSDRERLMARTALYTAIPLEVFGNFFCEMTVDEGPLMTPIQTLDLANDWIQTALDHIANTGDFPITTAVGQITSSAETMAYGLRARILWAQGDLAGAAAAAANVPNGFYAYVLREEGEDRRNMVSSMQGGGGGTDAAGFLQGPVELKHAGNIYGISFLGTNPVTGDPWPNPVPFTGYLDLAIAPDGRAVDASGYPITTATAGAVADVRVQHAIGGTAGGLDNIVQKYPSLASDIPLVSWVEMRLIEAEYEWEVNDDAAAAIDLVNQVRTGSVYTSGGVEPIALPEVTYGPTGDEVDNMIIEERRRGLWLEARFWATKILNPDRLWFPRGEGDWVNANASYSLNGGVRLLMSDAEYEINDNLSLADRGTGCDPAQAPIF